MSRFFLIVLFVSLYGCEGAFQPLPPHYELWQKSEATTLDVKKILLECGEIAPSGVAGGRSMNEMALAHYCVVNAGFVYLNPFKGKPDLKHEAWCLNWPDLPACQPGAEIPTPSVERRLNSYYCKMRTSFDFCYKEYMSDYSGKCNSYEYPFYNRKGTLVWNTMDDCLKEHEEKAVDSCESAHYKLTAVCLP